MADEKVLLDDEELEKIAGGMTMHTPSYMPYTIPEMVKKVREMKKKAAAK